jgi:DNA-binding CsgD family transcriptional regulator
MRRAEPGAGHDASDPAYIRDLEEHLWLTVFEQTSAARSGAAVLLVRGALACGDRAKAARLAQATQALADAGDGAAGNSNLATAAVHARGLVDGDTAALERAADRYSAPLARAAATEDAALAAAANGDRAAAVARLRGAYEIYEQHGRPADMARVRARLRETGVRLHHWRHADRPAFGWDSLTDTEYRIARLVAQGLSNREVAGQIYLSAHTVAFHLRHIFWKLDVSSRVQLARLVAEQGQGQGALRRKALPGGLRLVQGGEQQAADHRQVLVELDPLQLAGGLVLQLPVRVPGEGGRDQRAGQGQGGQPRRDAQRQQAAGRHLHGGVRPHHEFVAARQRRHLADAGQHGAGLLDAGARRAQRVEAEQDVGGAGEHACGRAQRRQHTHGLPPAGAEGLGGSSPLDSRVMVTHLDAGDQGLGVSLLTNQDAWASALSAAASMPVCSAKSCHSRGHLV